MKVKIKVWIEDDEENLIFGSGKTEVLENIDNTGSIAEAAKKVGMNYKKAWTHIKILEKHIEEDLVLRFKGRGENSGTTLTPKAREVIQTYKILEHDIKKYSEQRFKELFHKNGKEILSPKEDK
ncbi:winged helix-turn-helix domain-containing protein [Malaciobacter marinus]|uniref:Molybdenum transporter n=1 Tax=Malaciobacter marinus TaxID=505249 RepID=A0A347TM75_9BACT|nr:MULTISPECIES: LysR family transcriptional regulator [Malaciobacter]AXX87703.1 transcriptional regulator, ModE family [Malaciobacter marinus]PHO12333.1 molybdenum transporter [Malaciobacter marinus]PHO15343.1 molybdenum transporter [Malaciobacter marinus]RYA24956.1 molybdenum transporter [Malaciobacter halophilus]